MSKRLGYVFAVGCVFFCNLFFEDVSMAGESNSVSSTPGIMHTWRNQAVDYARIKSHVK